MEGFVQEGEAIGCRRGLCSRVGLLVGGGRRAVGRDEISELSC